MPELVSNYELYRSSREDDVRKAFFAHFKGSPIPDGEVLSNLGLFLSSKNLSRLLYIDFLYCQILDIQGIVVDFGARWGQNLSEFAALRGIYEPFNRYRKIVGFDTFKGFPVLSSADAIDHPVIHEGGFGVTPGYENYLDKVMQYQEADNPMSHVKRYEIRKGRAEDEFKEYLRQYPETIVALAFFDMDIYEPTKACLEMLRGHLVKGSVLAFDELNDHDSPGETLALYETWGLGNIALKRWQYFSRSSYFVVE